MVEGEQTMDEAKNGLLAEIKDLASQCDRCGSCNLVCPLFAISDKEAASPRGRINAARALARGGVIPEADVLKTVEYCLLCGSCTQVCASKVKTPDLMLKVREYFASNSNKQSAAEDETELQQAFDKLCQASAGLTGPAIATEQKAGYFFGRSARLNSLDIAIKTVKALNSVANVELVNNAASGLAPLLLGDIAQYRELIKQNIKLFAHVDTIVCDCASSADALKKAASYFADDEDWREQAQAFSNKVVLLSEYLVKNGYKPQQTTTEKITYHEHSRFGGNAQVKKAARQLLTPIGEFVDMPGADVSCGCGAFAADYPAEAAALLAKKVANIEKSGASVVVTECYHCLSRLKAAAAASGGKFSVVHLSEII
jgi:glycolate oxidase iron-sulfur subunit